MGGSAGSRGARLRLVSLPGSRSWPGCGRKHRARTGPWEALERQQRYGGCQYHPAPCGPGFLITGRIAADRWRRTSGLRSASPGQRTWARCLGRTRARGRSRPASLSTATSP